jgi:hypothetical protein
MSEQVDVIVLRCKECRRLRPTEPPTAIGRLVRAAGGRWQADLFEHVPYVRQPWRLGVNDLSGDDRYGLAGDDGRLEFLSLAPIPLSRDIRVDRLSCRGNCGRAPFTVRRAKIGGRAVAQGSTEIDV